MYVYSNQDRKHSLTAIKFVRWIGVEASGLVVELACWVFAVTLVWTLNMPLHRRLKLILIFAMRLL